MFRHHQLRFGASQPCSPCKPIDTPTWGTGQLWQHPPATPLHSSSTAPAWIKCPKSKGLSRVSHGSTSTALPSIATESHGKSFGFLQGDFGAAHLWPQGADNVDPPSTDRTSHRRHLHGPTDLSMQGAGQHSRVPFPAMFCPSAQHQSPRAPAQSTSPVMETYFSCHISQEDQTDSDKL